LIFRVKSYVELTPLNEINSHAANTVWTSPYLWDGCVGSIFACNKHFGK